MVYNKDPIDKEKAIEKTYTYTGIKKEKEMVSGKAFCVIAIPHDKLQHPVQVRDNYSTTVYKQNINMKYTIRLCIYELSLQKYQIVSQYFVLKTTV